MSDNKLTEFFENQLQQWPDARQRYDDLANIRTRGLKELRLQFNPARMVSTGAKIDKQSLAKRPCFLCATNRPVEQMTIELGRSEMLINPFPILPRHYTIPLKEHRAQDVSALVDEIQKVLDIDPTLMVFYNGPHCGASAPDHAHLQAGTSGLLPVQRLWSDDVEWKNTVGGCRIGLVRSYVCPVIALKCSAGMMEQEASALLVRFASMFDMNIITWLEKEEQVILVFPRKKHRPDCYADGVLVSPGAIDMGGVIITPREEDFETLDYDTVAGILREVSFSEEEVRSYINQI